MIYTTSSVTISLYVCMYHLSPLNYRTFRTTLLTPQGESMAAVANMAINGSALPTAIPDIADAAPKAAFTKNQGRFFEKETLYIYSLKDVYRHNHV